MTTSADDSPVTNISSCPCVPRVPERERHVSHVSGM